MEGHRMRVGALAWSSSLLSSGSRDKIIFQRDIRAQEDSVSKLTGHKSEVRFFYVCLLFHSISLNAPYSISAQFVLNLWAPSYLCWNI